jgi:hypothetical protein
MMRPSAPSVKLESITVPRALGFQVHPTIKAFASKKFTRWRVLTGAQAREPY